MLCRMFYIYCGCVLWLWVIQACLFIHIISITLLFLLFLIVFLFVSVVAHSEYVTLSNNKRTVTASGGGMDYNKNIRCSMPTCVDGVYSYSVRIDTTWSSFIMIGVAPSSLPMPGNYDYDNCGFWMYLSNGSLYSQAGDRERAYAQQVKAGSTVTCSYDTRAHTVSYAVDGVEKGVAFRNVTGELYPAAMLYKVGDIITFL